MVKFALKINSPSQGKETPKMSKEFSRISIEHLCSWILKEYDESNQIFGIHKDLFFTPEAEDPFKLKRYGCNLETPLGVAAGPHTQMAQNIVAAWLCGARYIELKTIQTLDEIDVLKPCIDIQDEGYNCEWSQELRLKDSFDEYLNAWILIHMLRHKFGWQNDDPGMLFNMSVGYNLEGILKENVQHFLDQMADCKEKLNKKIQAVKKFYPEIEQIDIPSCLSDNVTLSTMHGCPPEEIEKIGQYLLKERGYHTTVKLNPTLLGKEHLRHILNDKLGFETHVPDEAFEHDLKYEDGITLIKNLSKTAAERGLEFGIKLTNTLETENHKDIFPREAKMMYMSGRALHPISINVAARLQNEFHGELDLNFSGGADCFNLHQIIAAGIKPVTVCSDILKPGGYGRLAQYLENLRDAIKRQNCDNIDDFILDYADSKDKDIKRAALINLRRYAGAVVNNPAYKKESKTGLSVKTMRELPVFDCIGAPCIGTCPAGQDIPSYLYYTAKGDYKKAFEIIMKNNPLPHVLGMVCDHQCQHKCTRSNYDQSILIREVKRFIAAKNKNRPELSCKKPNGKKVGIIGAGPTGLSCAYFLALEGFEVEIFETESFSGGMVADAIPSFRLTKDAIEKDIEFIQSLGVKISYDQKIDKKRFKKLQDEFDYVYIAIGAQAAKKMGIPGEDAQGVHDQLSFLSKVRRGYKVEIGPKVAVIGGGNSAMDAARTAHRLVGDNGKVTVVYRRTQAQMPADQEEIKALLEEGIEIKELHQPLEILDDKGRVNGLKCQKMKLGDKGKDGRRRPVPIKGEIEEFAFDTVIEAIGQDVVTDFISAEQLKTDPVTGLTQLANVFAGGDAVRGASTIVNAVGDGQKAAGNIITKAGSDLDIAPSKIKKDMTPAEFQLKSARKVKGIKLPEIEVGMRRGFATVIKELSEEEAKHEARRCLYCNDLCNVCVSVCPNRANRNYHLEPGDYIIQKATMKKGKYKIEHEKTLRISQDTQVFNIGDFCNECGNCTTFCPTSGDPYKTKPKFYLSEASYKAETDNAWRIDGHKIKARFDGHEHKLEEKDDALHYQHGSVHARLNKDDLSLIAVEPKGEKPRVFSSEIPVKMGLLYQSLKNQSFNY